MSKNQNYFFFTIIGSIQFKSVEETQKLETDIGIAGSMETGKIWYFEWSLSTKLDFELEFALQIARQAVETRLLPKLKEKAQTFFTRADATLDLYALGERQEFCVEAVPNGKRELLDFSKTFLSKSWKIRVTRNVRGLQRVKRINSGVFRRKRWKICVIKWKRSNVPVWRFWISHRVFRMIVKVNNFFCQ